MQKLTCAEDVRLLVGRGSAWYLDNVGSVKQFHIADYFCLVNIFVTFVRSCQ